MAPRKTNRKTGKNSNSHRSQALVIFWLVFVIGIIILYAIFAETIQKNFLLFKTRITTPLGTENAPLTVPLVNDEKPNEPAVRESERKPSPSAAETAEKPKTTSTESPSNPRTPVSEGEGSTAERPVSQPPKTQLQPEAPRPVQTRDRAVYFAQINRDGQILRSKVTRKIPVSDSPMLDTLKALLTGPSADELNKGIINLIPQNTRILSATVRGETAYISFSEDFLFNTFGLEGYIAQLRQIVWTVTEFSNIKDVQILIEGRRLDYLGEGIWIGSPISRQSF